MKMPLQRIPRAHRPSVTFTFSPRKERECGPHWPGSYRLEPLVHSGTQVLTVPDGLEQHMQAGMRGSLKVE